MERKEDWKAGIFSCCRNPVMCIYSCCIPFGISCMQGVLAKLLFESNGTGLFACVISCVLCCYGAGWNRTQQRVKLQIEGSYVQDVICSCCCPCCSVVQEWREGMMHRFGDDTVVICSAFKSPAN
mmetsp:Transcript_809/g.1746  ORF Transcript_809/g.1746 Transcript_809/m.1746 type:complete len:125 (+) Transcript_809:1242-1616(+)